MTLLVIDAGNTRIKWGAHENGQWLHRDVLATVDVGALGDVLAGWRGNARAVVANVAGPVVAEALRAALMAAASIEWVQGRPEQCGVRSSYAEPAQLGPDRWAALIGAKHLFEGACVVVNAGTTMTVDALSGESIFLGGCIVPGYDLMRGALDENTARLRLRDGEFRFFPDNTGDAIVSGALNALAGAIERMRSYMMESNEEDPLVVISGGNAALLASQLSGPVQVVDNLVLEGLVHIGTTDH